jgi:hypothetical protein
MCFSRLHTAGARSPERTVVSAQRGSVSVFDATYFGVVFKAPTMGHVDRQSHDRSLLLLRGAPRGRPLPPSTNASAPIRHRLPDFFRGLLARRLRARPAGRRRGRAGTWPEGSKSVSTFPAWVLMPTARDAQASAGPAFHPAQRSSCLHGINRRRSQNYRARGMSNSPRCVRRIGEPPRVGPRRWR